MSAAGPIMIVDDDEAIRQVVTFVLEADGKEVISAANGVEALERLDPNAPPSLILVDMMMPMMDGAAFIDALRAKRYARNVPVIVMSGYTDAEAQARALGAAGCLRKPVELDDLLEAVRRVEKTSAEKRAQV